VKPADEIADSFAGRSWDGLHPNEQEAYERGRELRESRERLEEDILVRFRRCGEEVFLAMGEMRLLLLH
jgi:hypothetical protein